MKRKPLSKKEFEAWLAAADADRELKGGAFHCVIATWLRDRDGGDIVVSHGQGRYVWREALSVDFRFLPPWAQREARYFDHYGAWSTIGSYRSQRPF
jgi:hypothetical protein